MPSYQFPVEATQIALFVRAAGGAGVDVFDPELAAPPTFVQSGAQFDPAWPFRPRPGRACSALAGNPLATDGWRRLDPACGTAFRVLPPAASRHSAHRDVPPG